MPGTSQIKTFITTRAEGNSDDLQKLANSHGIKLIEFPLIKTIPAELSKEELLLISQLHLFDWIIFTSANGVHYFFQNVDSENLPAKLKIATIGKKTAMALTGYNCSANYISGSEKSDKFAGELKGLLNSTDKLIWPTSKLAGNNLINLLKDICDITRVEMYETILPPDINIEIKEQIFKDNYDLIYFFSSSAVHNFEKIFKNTLDFSKIKAACIGEVTADTCSKIGVKPLLVATKPTLETLFNESVILATKNR